MASPAQLAANRLNSLKSTGPKSAAGLAVTRFNALKSGIDAKSLVIPGEDPAELEALATNYHLQFLPGSPVEQFLVDSLIHADWRLRRLHKREAQLLNPAPGEPVDEKLLDRLDRQINTAQRAWFRALKEVQNQIPARIEKELAEIEAAPSPSIENADEIGFVSPKTESAVPTLPAAPAGAPGARPKDPKPETKINLALRL